MKVLVAKRKNENKLRYYNGKCFVIGKSRAVDIGTMNNQEINEFINALYEHSKTTLDVGNIDYFIMNMIKEK